MLAYGAILPHPPFAVERIGKEHAMRLEKTRAAIRHIGEDLHALHIDTVVIISAHGGRYADALNIALHDPYIATLHAFGDMGAGMRVPPNTLLIDRLQRHVRRGGLQATLSTDEELDHGAAIPLFLLEEYLKGVRVVVLSPPVVPPKRLVQYGEELREVLDQQGGRIALLCSAELSHRHNELSPGGAHPGAQAFDDRIRHAFGDENTMALLSISPEDVAELGGQDVDALRLFWGALTEQRAPMRELAYEHPFGIGYLTMAASLV